MDLKKLAQSLHQYERRVLHEIAKHPSLKELITTTGLKEIEAARALQWLENKKAITVKTLPQEYVTLDKNGELYRKKGLPERTFLESIDEKGQTLSKLAEKTGLTNEEVNVCVGSLRQKGAIHL